MNKPWAGNAACRKPLNVVKIQCKQLLVSPFYLKKLFWEIEHCSQRKLWTPFFEQPILNSPHEIPARHWTLDGEGLSSQTVSWDIPRGSFPHADVQ